MVLIALAPTRSVPLETTWSASSQLGGGINNESASSQLGGGINTARVSTDHRAVVYIAPCGRRWISWVQKPLVPSPVKYVKALCMDFMGCNQ
jgi:hypothetical protein